MVVGEQQPEQRPDRRRCDSAGDRLTTGGTTTGGMRSIIAMPSIFTGGKPFKKQKNQCWNYYPGGAPKDVEIKVDLERVLPPVEEAVAEISVIV